MIRLREKAYSDYSSLLGYDTISMGVVPDVPAPLKVKTFKTLDRWTFDDRDTRFLQNIQNH
jgi:hypothetical protein